jgi:hypothetical protein
MDEVGGVKVEEILQPRDGYTTIRIYDDIATDGVFLAETGKAKIYENEDIEIYEGRSEYIYYQGIRAKDLNKESKYTYNIKSYCTLTEDRLIAYDYRVNEYITKALVTMDDSDLAINILSASGFESKVDFDDCEVKPSDTFLSLHRSLPEHKRNPTISGYIAKYEPEPEKTIDDFFGELESLCASYDIEQDVIDNSAGVILIKLTTGELEAVR